MSPTTLRIALAISLFLGATELISGANNYDLSRVTPVPANEQIPVVDFFRPLALQRPELNRSGSHIAAIVTVEADHHDLLVYERETQKVQRIGGIGDKDIGQFWWLNDSRLMFRLSTWKLYSLGMLAADLGKFNEAYPLLQFYGSQVIAVPTDNNLLPLVWNRYDGLDDSRKDLGAATINPDISTGKYINLLGANAVWSDAVIARENNEKHIVSRFPLPGPGVGAGYLADKDGRLEFAFTIQDGVETMHRLVDNHWEKCPVDLDRIDVIDCADEPGQLVVLGPRQVGKPRALQLMDGATGQLGRVLLQDEAYDFYGEGLSEGRLYRDPSSHRILGATYERNGPTAVWFDEGYGKLQGIMERFFPGVVVRILGSDAAQKIFLVVTFSDRQPAIYSWVDPEKRSAALIKKSAPWIDPNRMRPMSIISFKTRDGRKLDAYLTLPAGASKENPPPLVVLPHGGPWVRDSWGFDGEVQFLASRGYAVLQPNYRGSNGYGWMFPWEDNWDFLKMHDDVTDATRAVIKSKLIDGSRVAILGTSFGGYLALTGVINEPSLYRCAVTIAGVSDWAQQVKDKKYYQFDSGTYGYFLRKIGDPDKDVEKFDAISPGRHVDRIRVPIFVAHGKEDEIVDIGQSKRLISELKKYNVPYESLLASEEGHGMAHLKNEVELYTRIDAFLAKNLASAAAGAGVGKSN